MNFNIMLTYQVKEFFNVIFNIISNMDENIENKNEHILKNLWDNYGIKRKYIGNDLVLLNYCKSHDKYDKTNPIIGLCRHLILDLNSMSIRSLGVTKSLDIETVADSLDISKCVIQKFHVGTMIVYNPSMITENRLLSDNESDNDVEVNISTRNKIGTSSYNTNVSFKEYFNYNNYINNINIEKLPSYYCYVFNCENTSEHITNINVNTLVCCYKFKSISDSLVTYHNYLKDLNANSQVNIDDYVNAHCDGLVEKINNSFIIKTLQELECRHIKFPIEYDFSTYTEIQEFVNSQNNVFQGLVIYDEKGHRYKVRNKNYLELKELRGDLPLNSGQHNQENLFKIYWRLLKENNITKFLAVFDNSNIYSSIFNYFGSQIDNFQNKLYKFYQKANVKKQITKDEVPKHIGPLCYELHGLYLKNKTITTRDIVKEYVLNQDVDRIYWRIFEPLRYSKPINNV